MPTLLLRHDLSITKPKKHRVRQVTVSYRLIGADGVNLRAKHDSGEDQEEEAFEAQEDEEDDGCWWREGAALCTGRERKRIRRRMRRGRQTDRQTGSILTCPVCFKAEYKMEGHHDESMEGNQSNVHLERKQRHVD